MSMVPVTSSTIVAIGHDSATHLLCVDFASGGRYLFVDVPTEEHAALMAAESKGSHFAQLIKGRYAAVRIDPPDLLVLQVKPEEA